MGDALRGLGFEVDVERNASMSQFEKVADKFIATRSTSARRPVPPRPVRLKIRGAKAIYSIGV